jgi:hypothetical protein
MQPTVVAYHIEKNTISSSTRLLLQKNHKQSKELKSHHNAYGGSASIFFTKSVDNFREG